MISLNRDKKADAWNLHARAVFLAGRSESASLPSILFFFQGLVLRTDDWMVDIT